MKEEPTTETKRVVVNDDSKPVLAVAADALEDAGYAVMTVDSEIDANPHISSSRRPDLILIDVMTPMLNGDRKVRLLKERELRRDIPILLMSTKHSCGLIRIVSEGTV